MTNLNVVQRDVTPFVREERTEFGTVREALTNFAKAEKLENVSFQGVNAFNMANFGNQMMIMFTGTTKGTKTKPGEFVQSKPINIGVAISDRIRKGIINMSSILEFPIILHTNAGSSSDSAYLLVVSPTRKIDNKIIERTKVGVDATVTQSFVQEAGEFELAIAF